MIEQFEIPRDRWGRPLIIPPNGGKAVPYSRASSYGDVLDDKSNLTLWKQRMTALGLIERPDLQLAVAANREDKSALNKIADQALEHAGGGAKASIGTSLHTITEAVDYGETAPFIPEAYRADIEAYRRAAAGFEMVLIERFVVNDEWKIAGTPDRVVGYDGDHYIWDLKTGSVDYSWAKIAVQLASYATGKLYNPETGERQDYPVAVNPDWGIVLHLPSGSGVAALHWVDLRVGRRGIEIASQVKDWRSTTRRGVSAPLVLEGI